MYAAAAGGYEDDSSNRRSASSGGDSGGGGREVGADLDTELPVILPVQSFELHDTFRHYFFKNLAVFCYNAGVRIPKNNPAGIS